MVLAEQSKTLRSQAIGGGVDTNQDGHHDGGVVGRVGKSHLVKTHYVGGCF